MPTISLGNRKMPLWILSIPGSPRRAQMSQYLGSLNIPFEFIDGILVKDRRTEALQELENMLQVPISKESTLPNGDLGCMLAYFYACKRIVDEQIPWVMIIEDDTMFNPTFEKQMRDINLADFICSDWTFVHPNMGFSTLGQIVTYVGAKKILKEIPKIVATNLAIDLVLFSDLFKDFHYAVCYGTNFWLVDQNTPYNETEHSERMQINNE